VAVTDADIRPMWRAPLLWALTYVVLFSLVFSRISWSLGDTYSHLIVPALMPWGEAIAYAFGSGREYRPLFTLAIKASYEAVGTWLPFYQTLVVALFAALLAVTVWVCRPMNRRRALAACVAISCICGLHTSRIVWGFWPLNHYAAVIVCVMLAIGLALHRRRLHDDRGADLVGPAALGTLTFAALLSLELGVLIVPLTIVLWWAGAPGLSRRSVVSVLAATAAYAAIRFTLAEYSGESLYADTGFIFQTVDAATLRARFGGSPWLLWGYNVASTMLTILLSEPREGVYSFVESLLAHDMESWRWFHVGTSALTTTVIAGGLLRGWPWKERDRLLVAAGCTLLVCGSALGFMYTRDRIGLAGGIGYALLLYVALAAWLEKMPAARRPRRAIVVLVTIVAAAWIVRSAEMGFQLRDTAWDYRVEWTDRFEELGAKQEQTAVMDEMRATALARTPADPRLDPGWTYVLWERRFRRSTEGR
jgi:hypothetical protein